MGVWLEGAFHFSTGSLAAGNLAHNPAITLHLESGAEVLIVESVAREVIDPAWRRAIVAYNEKYLWDVDDPETWYEVFPQVAFGWLVDDSGADGGATFHGTTTRWTFTS